MEQSSSVGWLGAIVWPTYVGVCNAKGEEPISDPNYQRGAIAWNEVDGQFVGNATVNCPEGTWDWVIYCYSPTAMFFPSSQKLAHPVSTGMQGFIRFERITEDDFGITNQVKGLDVLKD